MKYFNSLSIVAILLATTSLFSCKKNGSEGDAQNTSSSEAENVEVVDSTSQSACCSSSFPIAYVNVDCLLLNYNYAKDLNESLLKKEERSRKELKSKADKLKADYESMMKKYQAGAYLSEDQLRRDQESLAKQEQDVQMLDAKLTQELMAEQQKTNKQLRDTIISFFKVYNADKRYKYILSDAGVLYVDDALNITQDVLDQLNAKYVPNKKK